MVNKTRLETEHGAKLLEKSGEETENLSLGQIEEAKERLDDVAKVTPVDTSSTIAERSDAEEVCLKMEIFQRTGAFKIRGAYNKIAQLSEEEKQKGVIAASSGNHAQGVALAASQLGVDATIVMPENTPESKKEATSGYGAEIVLEGSDYEEAYQHARKMSDEDDLTFIHPYDDEEVMAGQGTLGLELLNQYPELDTVLVAVGGGGLISGVAKAIKSFKPGVKVVGVQTEGCGSAKQTLNSDSVYERDEVDTVAKGIATRKVGETTSEIMRKYVDEVVYVTDEQVEKTVSLLTERQKVVVEPAGAVAATAVMEKSEELDLEEEKVAVPLCGGNVDLSELARIFES
jgi:threonine dehydratase